MRIGFFDDPVFGEHDAGPGHPERPERLEAVRRGLRQGGIEKDLVPLRPRPATREELVRVHAAAHVDRVASADGKSVRFDPDTTMGPRSWAAATPSQICLNQPAATAAGTGPRRLSSALSVRPCSSSITRKAPSAPTAPKSKAVTMFGCVRRAHACASRSNRRSAWRSPNARPSMILTATLRASRKSAAS